MDQTNALPLFIPPVSTDATSVLPAFHDETCFIIKVSSQEVRPRVYVYFRTSFGDEKDIYQVLMPNCKLVSVFKA